VQAESFRLMREAHVRFNIMSEEATAQVLICPSCGKAADADAKFCKYCASELKHIAEESSDRNSEKRACPACGGEVGDKAIFCGNCGETLPLVAPQDGSASAAPSATITPNAIDGSKASETATPTTSQFNDLPAKSQVLSPLLIVIGVVVLIVIAVVGISTIVIFQNVSSQSTSTPFVSRGLTTQRAQSALSSWVKSGSVTVLGVQEVSSENAAVAQLSFSSFNYKLRDPMFGGQNDKTYSGPGTAVFTHYTDGRWVLTKVTIGQGFDSVWWDNLNVEAR